MRRDEVDLMTPFVEHKPFASAGQEIQRLYKSTRPPQTFGRNADSGCQTRSAMGGWNITLF